jgi:uncharacterized membrane protein YfcA
VLSAYPSAVWALLLGSSVLIGLLAGLLGVGGGSSRSRSSLDVFFARAPLGGLPGHLLPLIVGLLASAVGVSGGTPSTPMLSRFSFPILPDQTGHRRRRAVQPGDLRSGHAVFLTAHLGTPGRTVDALGDVALFCVAALSLPALFVAPVAARWSVRAPVSVLRRLFALCLVAIALRLLLRN